MDKNLNIEVIYALKDQVYVKELSVSEGCTINAAIEQSGILDECQDINLQSNKVGIFSQLKELDTLVQDGDRIEIYRPLIADPKEARRRRAAE